MHLTTCQYNRDKMADKLRLCENPGPQIMDPQKVLVECTRINATLASQTAEDCAWKQWTEGFFAYAAIIRATELLADTSPYWMSRWSYLVVGAIGATVLIVVLLGRIRPSPIIIGSSSLPSPGTAAIVEPPSPQPTIQEPRLANHPWSMSTSPRLQASSAVGSGHILFVPVLTPPWFVANTQWQGHPAMEMPVSASVPILRKVMPLESVDNSQPSITASESPPLRRLKARKFSSPD